MAGTPFKLKGWSPFTKKSPAKDKGHGMDDTPHGHTKSYYASKKKAARVSGGLTKADIKYMETGEKS